MTEHPQDLRKAQPRLFADFVYALRLTERGLSPLLEMDEAVAIDSSERCAAGDLVALYHRAATGRVVVDCVRLTMDVMPDLILPFVRTWHGDVMPCVCFQTIAPKRGFAMGCDRVHGVHKIIGTSVAGTLDTALMDANAQHWRATLDVARRKPRRSRMNGAA